MGGSLRAKPVGVVRGVLYEWEWIGMGTTQSKLNGKSDQKFF